MRYCGMDFGTSNSTVGIWKKEKAFLSPLEDGKQTLPSAVFFNSDEHSIHYGRSAINLYTEGGAGRLMRALKSVLGTRLIHDRTALGRQMISFEDIIGLFIGHMKAQAEKHTDLPLESAVMGRPVFFVDDDPKRDQEAQETLARAARKQGFKYVEFQYEPVAAALDFEQTLHEEKLALVIDIGGGTSDFSVVRVSPEAAQKADRKDDVLATKGVHIGGTDFDKMLSLQTVMPFLGYKTLTRNLMGHTAIEVAPTYYHDLATWQKINLLYSTKTLLGVKETLLAALEPEKVARLLKVLEMQYGHRLAMSIEDAKIALSGSKESVLDLGYLERELKAVLKEQGLEEALLAQREALQKTLHETVASAGVQPEQIESVFLTGGSTAIPSLRKALLAALPQAHIVEGDMFGSIGMGLAHEAKRRFAA